MGAVERTALYEAKGHGERGADGLRVNRDSHAMKLHARGILPQQCLFSNVVQDTHHVLLRSGPFRRQHREACVHHHLKPNDGKRMSKHRLKLDQKVHTSKFERTTK